MRERVYAAIEEAMNSGMLASDPYFDTPEQVAIELCDQTMPLEDYDWMEVLPFVREWQEERGVGW